MSSSVSFPDWNVFSEREEVDLGAHTESASPAAEMAALLRTYQQDRREIEGRLAREQQWWLDALVQQAILAAQFEIVLSRYDAALREPIEQLPEQASALRKAYRSFRILKDQMIAQLTALDLNIDIPLGKTYHEVESAVVIEGWRHHQEYSQEMVVEVREPVVYFKGELVHQGKVIMGGPLQEDDASLVESETPSA